MSARVIEIRAAARIELASMPYFAFKAKPGGHRRPSRELLLDASLPFLEDRSHAWLDYAIRSMAATGRRCCRRCRRLPLMTLFSIATTCSHVARRDTPFTLLARATMGHYNTVGDTRDFYAAAARCRVSAAELILPFARFITIDDAASLTRRRHRAPRTAIVAIGRDYRRRRDIFGRKDVYYQRACRR